MTRLVWFLIGGFCLAVALWLRAALAFDWPAWPLDADVMSVPQILLAYGLMPRGVVALLAGAALGLAGALLQAVLRNPIADPTTLGISAGAQLAMVAATVFAPELLSVGRWPVAMVGAALAAAIVMTLGARRGFAPATMVISGMLVGLTASSIATAITLSQGQYLLTLVMWNGGSLVQQDWGVAGGLAAVLVVAGGLSVLLARPLRILSLGEAGAASLGMNVAVVRLAVLVVAVWLTASVSAAVGMVAFVGLAAPAVVRGFGARTHGQILMLAPLVGAVLLSVCDGVVMVVAGWGATFPTGAVTGLIGGPLLLWLTMRLRGVTPAGTDRVAGMATRLGRPVTVLAALSVALVVAALVLVWIGRVPAGWFLLDAQTFADFLPMRLPRLAAAAASGGVLALAGAIMQRMTANPLASPEVIGVSGGAALGFAATVFLFVTPSAAMLLAGSAVGAAVVLGLVASVALRRGAAPDRVLLSGIALSSLAAAVLSALMSVGDQRSWRVLEWLSGSSSAVGPVAAASLVVLSLVVLGLGLMLSRWLDVLPLGEGVAMALGLPLVKARLLMILVAGVATGSATLMVGPFSFVGLMAPHIARRMGFARPAHQLAGAFLIGALLMLVADFGARMATFPYELPLGLFASLIGGPYLIWLMMRKTA